MADAEEVWRGENESKRRVIRSVWPALADALDGTPTDDAPPPAMCATCHTKAARGEVDGSPICSACVGALPPSGTRRVYRRYGR